MATRSRVCISLLVIGLVSLALCGLIEWKVRFPLSRGNTEKDDLVTNYLSAAIRNHLQTSTSKKKLNHHETLLTMVISSPGNKARRDTIRETWKNSYVERGKQFDVKFVLGTFGLGGEEEQAILAENETHNDLVLLTDHLDSYNNVTMKVLCMFVWADLNMQYSYLLKADDDSFARLDVFESELAARKSEKELYWGRISANTWPLRRGKWKENNWDLGNYYPPYAHGGGYVLSAGLIHRIAINADLIIPYHNEDISVGAWVSSYMLERKHDNRFDVNPPFAGDNYCRNSQILIHYQSTEDMRRKYHRLISKEKLCE